MTMATLTISRFLEGILRKKFHGKVQKQLKTIGHQDIAASDSSKQESASDSYLLRYLVDKYFMYVV